MKSFNNKILRVKDSRILDWFFAETSLDFSAVHFIFNLKKKEEIRMVAK